MSKRLLLADDSITIQKVIGITFAHEDYVLTVVDNGDAALSKARAERPDLILADVLMPGKNGYEVCAAVRQDPQLRHIPVLLLTGTFEPFDEAKARAAGADSWIAKPFESQSLIDRVAELLARASVPPSPTAEPTVTSAPAAGAAADFWGELEIAPSATDLPAEGPAEGVWEMPADAGDDLWGEVPSAAAAPLQAGADDWSGLVAEVDSAVEEESVPREAPATVQETAFLDQAASLAAESAFQFEESPVAPEDSLRFEEPAATFAFEEPAITSEDTFSFEEVSPAKPEDTFSFDSPAFAEQEISRDASFAEEDAPAPAAWAETDDTSTEWAGFEEDILPLDESDIIEEEDLEAVEPAAEFGAVGANSFSATETTAPPVRSFAAQQPAAEAVAVEFQFEEEGFPVGDELPPIDEPEWEFPAEETVLQPVGATAYPEGRAVAQTVASSPSLRSSAATPQATPAAVEEKVASLSEEEIGRIVEKVAGPVIERLAQLMLEKIAWEVVPDLAESMIRDEIRKIRESVVR